MIRSDLLYFNLIYIAVFLMPFYSLKISILHVSDLFIILSFFVLLIHKLKNKDFKNIKLANAQYYIYIIIIGVFFFFSPILISDLFNQNINEKTISNSLQYFLIIVVFTVLLSNCSAEKILSLLKAYIFGFSLVIALGVFLKVFIPSIYLDLMEAGIFIGFERMGSFTGPTGLAKIISILFIIALFLYITKKIKFLTLIIMYTLFFLGLFHASSFGGTLSSIISFTVVLIVIAKNKSIKPIKKIAGGIIGLGIIFLIFLNLSDLNIRESTFFQRIIQNLQSFNLDQAGSFEIKSYLIETSFTILKDNWLIGIGSGQFIEETIYEQNVHNTFLILWVEYGILPLLGFLGIILLMTVVYNFRCNSNKLLFNTIIVVFVINSITNTHFYPRFIFLPLLLIFIYSIKKRNEEPDFENITRIRNWQ